VQLKRLDLHNIRSIKTASLEFLPGVNLIYGKNGSGKTSILEALALFAQGRSFVVANNRELINHGAEELTCALAYAHHQEHQAGFSLDTDGKRQIRLDGGELASLQLLARNLPLLFVTPRSFQLLEGSSKERRRLVDWLVFHVEPEFAKAHSGFSRLLAQRNALLKRSGCELETWDRAFAEASEEVNHYRLKTFQRLQPMLKAALRNWLKEKDLKISSHQGWSTNADLVEQLGRDREQDKRRGFTAKGAHRYDLLFSVSGHKASQALSRGEKKRLILALVFAQICMAREEGVEPILLIDDLPAELDQQGCRQTVKTAMELCPQLLVTSIEKTKLRQMAKRVFHMEHGRVLQE